jgi:hypothetical protein
LLQNNVEEKYIKTLSLRTREVTFKPSAEVKLFSEMGYRRPLISSLEISAYKEHRPVHTVLNIPKATKKLNIEMGYLHRRIF